MVDKRLTNPNFFSFWGENLTYTYDEKGLLICSSCGSTTFDMVAESRISDVTKGEGDPAAGDPVANRTTESENVVSLVCARCGARIK